MERTTAFLVMIAMALLVGAPTRPQDLAALGRSAAERVGSNVLSLTVTWKDEETAKLGFGFVAGSDGETVFVATANHTLRGTFPEEVAERVELRTPLRPGDPIEGSLFPLFEPAIDLGVVAVPAKELDWKANVLPPTADELALSQPVWTVRAAEQAVWEVNLSHGTFAGRNPIRHELRIDGLPVFPSSSGSPLLAAGGLVGMIVRDSEMSGTTAIAIAAIRQQFAAWNLPWGLTDQPDATVLFERGFFQRGASPRDLVRLQALLEARAPDRRLPDYGVATPAGNIELSRFEIDAREVTWGQFQAFLAEAGLPDPVPERIASYLGSDERPAVGVTWAEADAYCRARGKRLPTEAEWERAARGTHGRLFPWGDTLEGLGGVACGECAPGGRAPDGPAATGSAATDVTPEGVADLGANAREWVSDWYSGSYYLGRTLRDPENLEPSEYRVVRGASWFDPIQYLPTFRRSGVSPGFRDPGIGFRCARRLADDVSGGR